MSTQDYFVGNANDPYFIGFIGSKTECENWIIKNLPHNKSVFVAENMVIPENSWQINYEWRMSEDDFIAYIK